MKTCGTCKAEKPLSEFYQRKSATGGHKAGDYLSRCKECHCSATRNRMRVRQYGLTTAEAEQLFDSQGRACAICRTTDMRPVIDHNHETGEVRAILCDNCNLALGNAKDSPAILRACAEYLELYGHYGR